MMSSWNYRLMPSIPQLWVSGLGKLALKRAKKRVKYLIIQQFIARLVEIWYARGWSSEATEVLKLTADQIHDSGR